MCRSVNIYSASTVAPTWASGHSHSAMTQHVLPLMMFTNIPETVGSVQPPLNCLRRVRPLTIPEEMSFTFCNDLETCTTVEDVYKNTGDCGQMIRLVQQSKMSTKILEIVDK